MKTHSIYLLLLLFFSLATKQAAAQCSNDTIPPVAICQNITATFGTSGSIVLNPINLDGGSTDNCGISSMTVNNQMVDTFTCNDLGVNTVVFAVTDQAGNTATCMAQVTVIDIATPTANCQSQTVYLNQAGTTTITAQQINAGSTDDCGINSITINGQASLSYNCSNIGTQTATLTVQDMAGNMDQCMATITVLDINTPTINHTSISKSFDCDNQVILCANDFANVFSDNCSISNLLINGKLCDTLGCGGSQCSQNVVVMAMDLSGNTISAVVTVNMTDTCNIGNTQNTGGIHVIGPPIIYPNPSNGFLNIQTEGEAIQEVIITAISGQKVYQRPVKGDMELQLDLRKLHQGNYIITIITKEKTYNQSLLLSR